MLLKEMKENYLNHVKIYLSNGTYRCYKCHLDYFFTWLEKENINDSSEINTKLLSKFIICQHSNNVKNSTINKRIKPLKLMFEFNNINNEILDFSNLKEERKTFTSLTNSELNRLVDYLNNGYLSLSNKVLIYLLIDTGVRVNELLNIKISNINFMNNTILLDVTKTKNSRVVPFTEATSILLKDYLNNCIDNNLFNITLSSVSSLFARIRKKLNLSKFHPHMLRHTLASKLHKNGVSVFIIQQIMGHTNVTTTERYIHFDLDDILLSYDQVMNN